MRIARPSISRPSAGFTLLELITVMGVVAILATIGVPSFKYVTSSSRVSSEVNALLRDLQYARSEAIRQGLQISVCVSSNGTSCTGGTAWQQGWLVFTDSGTQGIIDGTDAVLRMQNPFNGTDTLTPDKAMSYVELQPRRLRDHAGRQPRVRAAHRAGQRELHALPVGLDRRRAVDAAGRPDGRGESAMHLRRRHPQAAGFSIIEVMIALFVISIGLLGIAKLEASSISSTNVANRRSLAAIEAASLAASMHVNRGYWTTAVPPARSSRFKTAPSRSRTARRC